MKTYSFYNFGKSCDASGKVSKGAIYDIVQEIIQTANAGTVSTRYYRFEKSSDKCDSCGAKSYQKKDSKLFCSYCGNEAGKLY